MDYKTAQRISIILFLVGMFFLALMWLCDEFNIYFIVTALAAMVCVAAAAATAVAFYRCPYCRKSFYLHFFTTPKYCSKCGKRLETNKKYENE